MTFTDRLKKIQEEFVGYSLVIKPVDIGELEKGDVVKNCKIIASKDQYNILYMEVESNWKGIATNVAKNQRKPCLVITPYGDSYLVLSTVDGIMTNAPKPRHLVIDQKSKSHSLQKFVELIQIENNDDFISIDKKTQCAFDVFSEYKEALNEFGENLDTIIKNTKTNIENAIKENKKYDLAAEKFLKVCREIIDEKMDKEDILDMLIQHFLTYRIFAMIYNEQDFHNTNTVARELESLKNLLNLDKHKINYDTIELIAESITEPDQKQEFLKRIYETFYAKYDPDRADKNGIVYTPSEVVNFIVKSTDELLKKHFQKTISDDGITILDPATGTGTFLVHILRQIDKEKLKSKYMKELYANEISILPYYIAALNIENVYKERTGKQKEFPNICWVDTLDSDTITLEEFNDDNIKRIARQRKKKIFVVIGNPPYNATQTSFNNVNPADKYPMIDEQIKEDYSQRSSKKIKKKSFDMYKRFLKWSSNKINKNKIGMIVFITNNSFLDAKADDGTRRALYDEFDYIYSVNLKGNMNVADWHREGGKIFGSNAKIGIAISFFIKTGENHSEIQYCEVADYQIREAKLKWLNENTVQTLNLRKIIPDEDATWLNQTDNNFDELIPVLSSKHNESIFSDITHGVVTSKDDWVYDIDQSNLKNKMKYYISIYNNMVQKYKKEYKNINNLSKFVTKKIKWSHDILKHMKLKRHITYSNHKIKQTLYRPFIIKYQYYDDLITERSGDFIDVFKNSQNNMLISFPNPKTNVIFRVLGTNLITDYGLVDGTQNIPFWKYNDKNEKYDNITEYAMTLFQNIFKNKKINKEDIFYYVYGIFNDPKYEQKYKYDLRRHFPRIPLAKEFKQYKNLGKKLFDLHCDFNNSTEYPLKRIDKKVIKNAVKLSLKREKDGNKIIIDSITTLTGIPDEVFEYVLGPKNPLVWVLYFYKEKKNWMSKKRGSNDEEIRERFSTYRFTDHKEEVITLLKKVTTVCVETVKIRKQLELLEWGKQPKLKFTKISDYECKETSSQKKKIPKSNTQNQCLDKHFGKTR